MKIICRYMMLSLLLAVHFVTSLGANAQSANGIHTSLPVLTTALVVHSLPPEQAARSYPVHLRGVVTYYNYPHCFSPIRQDAYIPSFRLQSKRCTRGC